MDTIMSINSTVQASPIIQIRIDWTLSNLVTKCPYDIYQGDGLIIINQTEDYFYTLDIWGRDFYDRYYNKTLVVRNVNNQYVKYTVKHEDTYIDFHDNDNKAIVVSDIIAKNDSKYTIINEFGVFIILDLSHISLGSFTIWGFNMTFPRYMDYIYTTITCRNDENNIVYIPCITPTILQSEGNLQISGDNDNLNITYNYDDIQTTEQPEDYITSINGTTITSPNVRIVQEFSENLPINDVSQDILPIYSVFSNLFSIDDRKLEK